MATCDYAEGLAVPGRRSPEKRLMAHFRFPLNSKFLTRTRRFRVPAPRFPLNSDFSAISATSHFAAKPLGFPSTPIFQRFPKARESVKYLVEDGRFDVIETGSLISIKENVENIVIPSEEVKIRMRPLTFEEFLHAAGKDVLLGYIRECWNKRVALDRAYHE